MNLVDVVKQLGDKDYSIGRPIYFFADDEVQQSVKIHAHPVREVGKPALIDKILHEKDSDSPAGIAVTYGGFLGVDIAAAHDAQGILLLDINPEQKHFWRSVIDLIKECPTPEDFKNRLSVLQHRHEFREEAMEENREAPYPSFLENDAVYKKVREWANSGMMASTDMDVLDTARHHKLAALLTEAQMGVKAIYLSNIPHFYDMTASNGTAAKKADFYSATVAQEDYRRIFDNQRIIASGAAKVVHATYNDKGKNFLLAEETLDKFVSPKAAAV